MDEWLKSKFSARSLFGENSMFGQVSSTLSDANFEGFGMKFGNGGATPAMNEAELLKYGMIGLFVWMILKK